MKKQYPENMFELSTRVFKFSPREGDDPSIEVKYTERFNEGWMITCKSSTKVSLKLTQRSCVALTMAYIP